MARSTPISDQDLAILLQNNDTQALTKIINRYQAPLMRYVSYLGCNDPEDSVQETFIKLYKNIQSYNPEKKFSSWLYRIAHNTTVSRLRSHHFTLPFAEYLDAWINHTEEVDLDQKELIMSVRSCLSDLSSIYREPLVLHYLEEKSYDEISDILRLPIGTVSARISRAKKKIKDLCKKK